VVGGDELLEVSYGRLPAAQFDRLLPVYEEMGEPLPLPGRTVLYAAESGGEVVGCVVGQFVVSVSPIWVREDFRGSDVSLRLAAEGYAQLPAGFQKVLITTNPRVAVLARLMGFAPKVGQLWLESSGERRWGDGAQ
jgi:hypothetical protein